VARWLESLAGAVASVVFASGCRICGALLIRADRLPFCDACLKSFRELPEEISERTRVALPTSFVEAGAGPAGEHLLHYEERSEAVRGAFVIRERGRVDNLRILLLDDVMTSGATLDACSRALREAGAKSVAGFAIARAVRQGIPVRESFSFKGAR
jgi:predicted amidophosphoribosyltransferase